MEEIQKYKVVPYPISTILTWAKSKEIAIPEIQRPFVWSSTQVRDLIDSLYRGYPVGFLITWKDPKIKLKGGAEAEGKKILIDGQQRITALMTSILGGKIIDKEYKRIKIKISFHPIEEKFAVHTPIIEKDKSWIPDIGTIVGTLHSIRKIGDVYQKDNPDVDIDQIDSSLEKLRMIGARELGIIELNPGLDLDTITEIFVRANQSGVKLTNADFVMSKLASYGDNGEGSDLRKCIDLFCHLAVKPESYDMIKTNDLEFPKTEYFKKISWLKDEKDDLYDPEYSDVLRVAFSSRFKRGKLSDLVSLLSGRNFETKEFEDEIRIKSFKELENGILDAVNETNFKRFIMILKSAGIISRRFYSSVNAVNLSYILYLMLKKDKMENNTIEKIVKKWFVLSSLTGRYAGSTDSTIEADVKKFNSNDIEKYLKEQEDARLSDAFWSGELISSLNQASQSSPYIGMFWVSQIANNDKGFLSKDIGVRELNEQRGDIHHLYPKSYLKKNGLYRNKYNQSANFVWTQTEINIALSDSPPKEYMNYVKKQCNGDSTKYGGIDSEKILKNNLDDNCIPDSIFEGTIDNYEEFLEERRKMMAKKIKKYYFSL